MYSMANTKMMLGMRTWRIRKNGSRSTNGVRSGFFVNKVIREDEVLDKQSLPKVKMPIGDDYAKLPEWKPGTPRLQGYPY